MKEFKLEKMKGGSDLRIEEDEEKIKLKNCLNLIFHTLLLRILHSL